MCNVILKPWLTTSRSGSLSREFPDHVNDCPSGQLGDLGDIARGETCVYRRRKRDIANKMRRKKKREERKRGRKESILLPQGLQSSSGLAWLCSVSVSSGLRLFPPLVCSACWPPALHQSLSGVRHQFHCEMGRPIGKLVAPHTLVLSLVYEKPSPHPVGSAGPVMDSWYFPFMALMK